jgi:hypothetical protein
MNKTKIFLIGVGATGAKAIDKLISTGVSASTMLIHDAELAPPDVPAFKFVRDDPRSQDQLRQLFALRLKNLKISTDDMVVVITELGNKLSTTISTLLSVCAQSDFNLTVIGVIPEQQSEEYDEAVFDSEYIQGHDRCKCFLGFPIDAVTELPNISQAAALDCITDFICHVVDTIINGETTGFSRVADMMSSNSLPYILGSDISSSDILIGNGKDPVTAFEEAVGGYNNTGRDSVAFSVSGDVTSVFESIELASDYFVDENLWMTHRVTDSDLVRVTMMVAFTTGHFLKELAEISR